MGDDKPATLKAVQKKKTIIEGEPVTLRGNRGGN
jgi:hypothetical protein